MGGPHGGHMGGPPIQNQAPQNQGDRFQAVTAYRFVGGFGHNLSLIKYEFHVHQRNQRKFLTENDLIIRGR